MGFGSFLSGIADIGTSLIPGPIDDAIVGGVKSLVGDGDSAPKVTGAPFSVPHRCPGSPSAEVFRQAFANAPRSEQDAFIAQWNRTNGDRYTWAQASADFNYVVYSAWGGNDCIPSSANGKALRDAAGRILQYAGDGYTALPPVNTPPSRGVTGAVGDILSDFGRRVVDGVVVAANDTVADAARPTVQRQIENRFFDSVPAIVLGGVIAWLAFRPR